MDGWYLKRLKIVNICNNTAGNHWSAQPVGTIFLYDGIDEDNDEIALKVADDVWLYQAEQDPLVTADYRELMKFLKARHKLAAFGECDPIEIDVEINEDENSFRSLEFTGSLQTSNRKYNKAEDYQGLGIYGSF